MRAYKYNGREAVRLRTVVVTILLFLCMAVQSFAIENKTFYTSGQINPGEQWNVVEIYGDSTVIDMLGGWVDVLHSFDASTTNMTGGKILTLVTYDYSTANISSGSIYYCHSVNHSIVNFSGDASVLGMLASEDSTLNLCEGYISDDISIRNNGMLNFYGGSVPIVSVTNFGVMELRGGVIENWIGAWEYSAINIYGHDLVKTNYGGAYGLGQVYGFWDDGTPFSINLYGTETYLHINLIEIVDVNVQIHPETLNLSSAGQWVTCEIFIPEDYNTADVNMASVQIQDEVQPDRIWFNDKQNVLMGKFNRSALQEILEPGEVELTVSGYFNDGTYFEGRDTIRILSKKSKE